MPSGNGARVVVEKPFGRDLAVGAASSTSRSRALPRERHLSHRPLPRQGAGAEPAVLPVRQLLPRADLEPQLRRRACRSPWPRTSASRARQASTRRPAPSATSSRTTCCSRGAAGHGAAGQRSRRGDPRREGQGAAGDAAAAIRRASCAASSRLRAGAGRRPDRRSRLRRRRACTIDSWRWSGVPFFMRAGKCLPVTATEVIVELKPPPAACSAPASSGRTTSASASAPTSPSRWAPAPRSPRRDGGRDVELSSPGSRGKDGRLRAPPRRRDGRRPALFAREDVVEAAWAIVDPMLRRTTVHEYVPAAGVRAPPMT